MINDEIKKISIKKKNLSLSNQPFKLVMRFIRLSWPHIKQTIINYETQSSIN
jgi:hypothetical protein